MSTFDHAALTQNINKALKSFRQSQAPVMQGFAQLSQAALADGAIDAKTKELIALAIAVNTQCDGCIASHARAAAKNGATLEEAAEAIGVTLLMGGGPASIYAPRAYAAFVEFYEQIHGADQA